MAIIYCWLLTPELLLGQKFESSAVIAGLKASHAESHSGVSVADYDMDGYLDVFLVASQAYDPEDPSTWSRLYRNTGEGTFTDETESAGLFNHFAMGQTDLSSAQYGASWGDYDNDGDPDLFLTRVGPEFLFRNEGNGTFSDVTQAAGLYTDDDASSTSSVWWDYDHDGDLDLYISVWFGQGSWANVMYENEGDGTFINVTDMTGLGDTGQTYTSIPLDANNDGLSDLYVVNDFGHNTFYLNKGDKTFEDATEAFGLIDEGHGMGVTAGDYNNDGFFDIYLTNIAFLYPNPLFFNEGNGSFLNVASTLGVEDTGWAWGTEFFDYDHDGDLDLYAVNSAAIGIGTNVFFKNELVDNNQLLFLDRSEASGTNGEADSRGLVVFDYELDGDLDMLVANRFHTPYLYTNQSQSANWLKVELVGTLSNRNAVGASVHMHVNGKTLHRLNDGVEFLGQSIQPVHFGIGDATTIDEIIVRWPTGRNESHYNVAANQTIKLIEGTGVATGIDSPDQLNSERHFQLDAAYPNPFTHTTTIAFDLPQASDIVLKIYNALGQEIAVQKASYAFGGQHEIKLDASTFKQSGVYIYRLSWKNQVKSGFVSYIR